MRDPDPEILLPAAPAGAERLRALLHEWLNTPFFETHADWLKWVQDFRPRVEKALYPQEHVSTCPRRQAWDHGEEQAPCNCPSDAAPAGEAERLREVLEEIRTIAHLAKNAADFRQIALKRIDAALGGEAKP